MIPARSLDVCEGFLGVPGTGKSSLAVKRLHQLQTHLGAYVLIHDPQYKVPDKLHDGTTISLMRHDNENMARAALRVPENATKMHAIRCPDGSDVIRFATKIGEESLRVHSGVKGVPVLVYIDEVLTCKDASPYRLGDDLGYLITNRRHANVGIIWGCQSPMRVHYTLLELCTKLYLFHARGKRVQKSYEMAGVPPEIYDRVPSLSKDDHEFLIFSP